jgi:hypothetical protein
VGAVLAQGLGQREAGALHQTCLGTAADHR